MLYDYKRYQLNSLRTGLITNNKLFNKISIFFNCASQSNNVKQVIQKYNELHESGLYNFIAMPVNLDNNEPGDNYDIYQYYENTLTVKFPVLEKIEIDHIFFKDFGTPTDNFTNYVFDPKLKFIRKTNSIGEAINV